MPAFSDGNSAIEHVYPQIFPTLSHGERVCPVDTPNCSLRPVTFFLSHDSTAVLHSILIFFPVSSFPSYFWSCFGSSPIRTNYKFVILPPSPYLLPLFPLLYLHQHQSILTFTTAIRRFPAETLQPVSIFHCQILKMFF